MLSRIQTENTLSSSWRWLRVNILVREMMNYLQQRLSETQDIIGLLRTARWGLIGGHADTVIMMFHI